MFDLYRVVQEKALLADGNTIKQFTQDDWITAWFYRGMETLVDAQVVMHPHRVTEIHKQFLEAGSDFVRTLTASSNSLNLLTSGIEDEAFAINYMAAGLARDAVDSVPGEGRRRFALGHIVDRGWEVDNEKLTAAFAQQAEALAAGGVDGIFFEPFLVEGRVRLVLDAIEEGVSRTGREIGVLVIADHEERWEKELKGELLVAYRSARRVTQSWLDTAIYDQDAGLIGGGTNPADTQKLDGILRLYSDDDYRPRRKGIEAIEDDFHTISSWRRFG